jgi:hypothetical protein
MEAKMTMNTVTETIYKQFGGFRAMAMIGGSCVYDNEKSSITVAFKAKALNKSNKAVIRLEADDTYTVEFWRIRGMNAVQLSELTMVYADQLQEVFEEATRLRLSL